MVTRKGKTLLQRFNCAGLNQICVLQLKVLINIRGTELKGISHDSSV